MRAAKAGPELERLEYLLSIPRHHSSSLATSSQLKPGDRKSRYAVFKTRLRDSARGRACRSAVKCNGTLCRFPEILHVARYSHLKQRGKVPQMLTFLSLGHWGIAGGRRSVSGRDLRVHVDCNLEALRIPTNASALATNLCAIHAKRVTIQNKDMQLVKRFINTYSPMGMDFRGGA